MKTKILLINILMVSCFFVRAQTLDALLQKAYDNNPELKALQLEYKAAMQVGPQQSQLSNPTLGIGIPILPVETRLGSQRLMVSASQMFPWFGTLKSREDVVLSMAKSKYERVADERLDIDFQIKTAYYNLYLLQEQQAIIRENIRIFETIQNVALAKVESGKSIASDVLTVQIKIEELNQQIQILEQQKHGFSAVINAAVNNPIDNTIQVDSGKIDFAILTLDTETIRQKIQSNHPLIKQLDWKIEASNQAIALNTLEGNPSFGLGLDYSMVSARTDASPLNNGRDILIPRLMVSIPLSRKKYNAKEEEEKLKQQAFSYQQDNLTNKMMSQIQGYKSEYESAKLMYDLVNRQMDLSNSAYEILLVEYSNKGTRFDELMKLQSDLNRYRMENINTIVKSHLAKFKIERLTDY